METINKTIAAETQTGITTSFLIDETTVATLAVFNHSLNIKLKGLVIVKGEAILLELV